MEFGPLLPVSGPFASTDLIVRTAHEAASLGYDSVWVHDRIIQTRELHTQNVNCGAIEAVREDQIPNFYESITTLSYIAGVDSDLKLGLGALVLPLRNPVVLAKQAASLDILSNGRLILGVCKGQKRIKTSFDAVGVSFEKRWSILKEYVQAIRLLWGNGRSSFRGKYVNFTDLEVYPKPKNIRIYFGVQSSPEGLRAAAELGDGWFPGHAPASEIRLGSGRLVEELGRLGKNPRNFDIGLTIYFSVGKDHQEAKRMAARTLLSRVKLGVFKDMPEKDVVEEKAIIGNPDEIIKELEEYEKAGVKFWKMMFIYPTIEKLFDSMKIFSKEIMPSFK